MRQHEDVFLVRSCIKMINKELDPALRVKGRHSTARVRMQVLTNSIGQEATPRICLLHLNQLQDVPYVGLLSSQAVEFLVVCFQLVVGLSTAAFNSLKLVPQQRFEECITTTAPCNPSALVVGAELFQIIYILPPVFVICTAMVNLRLLQL